MAVTVRNLRQHDMVDAPSYTDACALTLSAGPCAQSDELNLAVLTAVSALDAQFSSHAGDEGESRSAELQQLDAKMNVLIQMFAGFWRQQCRLPDPVPVEIMATGLRIPRAVLNWPDTVGGVELYLHAAMPQALKLDVTHCAPDPERAGMMLLRFALSDDLENALSRHVFRHHRRSVARLRKASNLHVKNE